MKLLLVLLALIFATPPALAAPLADQEKAFVYGMVGGFLLPSKCPNLKTVDDGGRKFADKFGVDFVKIGSALMNAILAGSGKPYDSGKLIPEVTREVNSAALELSTGLKGDRNKLCKEWADNLVPLGLMERLR